MSKIDRSEVSPPSKKALAKGAFLAHLDVCRACCPKTDELRVATGGQRVERVIEYDPCPVGAFLRDVWTEIVS